MELKINALSKSYGKKKALDNFTLTLNEGVYGILGPNGAGKSTLINITTGIIKADCGTISFSDGECTDYLPHLGFMAQNQDFYPNFTARELILYIMALKNVKLPKPKEYADEILKRVNLYEQRNKKIGAHSGGMKQRLGIAQAIVGDPKLLIFDEPTAGLDPKERIRFRNVISSLANDKIVILATHIVTDIAFVAKTVVLVNDGKIIGTGSQGELCSEIEGKVWEAEASYEKVMELMKDSIGEHRVLLAYDAPAMTVGQEYWLLFFICYISAASIYYERKINNLQKTSPNGKKGYAAKLLAVFSVICFLWLAFAAIEFFALLSTVSTENLSASLASLEDFKETPYSDMTILGGFWAIQLLKLIGYLFTSAVTLIIILISKNLVLSIFAPAALNVAWLYLFSNHTASYYQPFSLMRGAPYLTGARHEGAGAEYDEIPQEVLAVLITVAAVFVAIAYIAVICEGKKRLKSKSAGIRKKAALLSVITLSAMILGGCSVSIDESLESTGHDGFLPGREENYYILQYETDSSHQVIASKITVVDKDLNVISDNIIRDVFDSDPLIHGIYEDGGYIYYSGDFNDGSRINRISLDDFSEETVYFGDYAPFKGQRKYFDMITVWSKSYYGDSITVNDFFVNEGKAVISMQDGAVYLLDADSGVMTYLFEDSEVEGLCANNGKIYYLNMTGELICFYGSEKHRVSDRIFGGICSDGEYVYGCGVSGVYRNDNEFNETMLSGTKGSRISAYDGRTIFDSENGWVYIDGESEANIGEAEEAYSETGAMNTRKSKSLLILDENSETVDTGEVQPAISDAPITPSDGSKVTDIYSYEPVGYMDEEQRYLLLSRPSFRYEDKNFWDYIVYDETDKAVIGSLNAPGDFHSLTYGDGVITLGVQYVHTNTEDLQIAVYNERLECIREVYGAEMSETYIQKYDPIRDCWYFHKNDHFCRANLDFSDITAITDYAMRDYYITEDRIIYYRKVYDYSNPDFDADIFGIMDLDGNVIKETKAAPYGTGEFRIGRAGDYIYFMSPLARYTEGLIREPMEGIIFYNLKTDEQKTIYPEEYSESSYCKVTPDGKYLVTGKLVLSEDRSNFTDNIVKLYDVGSGKLLDTKAMGAESTAGGFFVFNDRAVFGWNGSIAYTFGQ